MKLTPNEWFRKIDPNASVKEAATLIWISRMENAAKSSLSFTGLWKEVKCRGCGRKRRASVKGRKNSFCPSCYAYEAHISRRATAKVSAAIHRGEIPPAYELNCIDCGKQAMEYDHRDYGEPLKIEPVCRSCNRKRGPAEPFLSMTKKVDEDYPDISGRGVGRTKRSRRDPL